MFLSCSKKLLHFEWQIPNLRSTDCFIRPECLLGYLKLYALCKILLIGKGTTLGRRAVIFVHVYMCTCVHISVLLICSVCIWFVMSVDQSNVNILVLISHDTIKIKTWKYIWTLKIDMQSLLYRQHLSNCSVVSVGNASNLEWERELSVAVPTNDVDHITYVVTLL